MKKRSSRFISALICLCLALGMIPIGALTAFAADTVTAATAYAGGSGTKEDPYQISNAAELLYFNEQCTAQGDFDNCGKTLLMENYHGAYFVLTDDIDCSGIAIWTPCCFAGNFDGQGHTISNLNIGYTAYNNNKSIYSGFFETFYEGTFQNLTFKGCKVEIPADLAVVHYANIYIGIVAAEAYYAGIDSVTIDSCSITSNPTTTTFRYTYIGGIAGGVDGVFFNRCMIMNTAFSATNAYMGGIVGQLVSMYYDASELIDLGVPLRFGGGAGKYGIENSGIDAKTTITNTVTYPDNYNYPNVGGMIGLWQPYGYDYVYQDSVNSYVKNNYCNAALNVTGGGAQGIGGFIGELSYAEYPVSVENCYFAGKITDSATERSGKGYIIGYATRNNAQSLTLNNCYGLNTLSLKALGEDRKYNGSYGGNTVKEKLGCATFGSNGVLTAETAGDTLAADNLLDALNAWVTKSNTETSSYLAWGKADSYPFFSADYTKVDDAIAKIPADLSVYTDTTVKALNDAVNAVLRDKNITEQETVNGYAAVIESAITALKYKDADYTKVDEAITKANALNKDDYKDFSAVDMAVNAVIRNKNITEQETVDAMEKAISDAVSALEKKLDTQSNDSVSAQTGDNSNMLLWIVFLFVSVIGFAGITYLNRKRKINREKSYFEM